MDCSTPDFLVLHYLRGLLKLKLIESVMPSNHLFLGHPRLSFPASGFFSNEPALHIRWPLYWSFSFRISSSSKYSGLISYKIQKIVFFPSNILSSFLIIYFPENIYFTFFAYKYIPLKGLPWWLSQ